MRMHEILGVEPMQANTYRDGDKELHFYVDSDGRPRCLGDTPLTAYEICLLINHPERIIRKPRLTGEQVAELKALATLGLRYTTKSRIGQIISHGNKPRKMETHWASERSINEPGFIHVNEVLGNLVSWSDPEPLDIVQTLKDAGVEV